jgi:hypothetical protein
LSLIACCIAFPQDWNHVLSRLWNPNFGTILANWLLPHRTLDSKQKSSLGWIIQTSFISMVYELELF